ncbi:TolB family protein [Aquirufa rosea]|uniref:Transporter n=1 Tax=Aquirufa rosea TaxID=2509241 RepID=A0A4Q1C066_9BACT|nr:TolB family protein [Aquirufa rosea]RXK49781.1 transporter [Aquirufa rosea]
MKATLTLAMLCLSLSLFAQIPPGKSVISSLHIYELKTKKSVEILKEHRHFEAPNWSVDGKHLLINSKGLLEKISPTGEHLGILPTGTVQKCNNDHGYSFDGKTLYISSSDPTSGINGSLIFKVGSEGGQPIRLTNQGPSYWHGISPDGKTMVYCAERDKNYDVYAMDTNGGPEIRLTSEEGLDDGPEYSPDGKYIYFNSYRSGKMQIWRMRPNGSQAEQMTFDDYSTWFAHIRPNGKEAVVISYIQDQKQNHPFGHQVKLRLLNLKNKKIEDLTEEFYGGQGTINVPSWSPDGSKFAYVRYELEDKKP